MDGPSPLSGIWCGQSVVKDTEFANFPDAEV